MSHLPPLTLPLPDGCLPLMPTLALVEVMEAETGSLYTLAADVLAARAAHGQLLRLLAAVYRHAGCPLAPALLEDFLMTLNAAKIVTEILAAVLTPLSRMDIAQEFPPAGEPPAARSGS